jgi:hypothetical protein
VTLRARILVPAALLAGIGIGLGTFGAAEKRFLKAWVRSDVALNASRF